jgi:glycosyltransferase involved in cell wall biosynthesis
MRVLNNSEMVVQEVNISVIIRTMGRPEVIQEALESIERQTYRNFEVVIVEDGHDISRTILKNYPDLRLQYHSTGTRTSRAKAGNIGLKMARGNYLIFLDDDDIFFPNHLEVLENALQSNPSYMAAYSIAYEVPTHIKSYSPFRYKEMKPFIHYAQPFNRLLMFYTNYIPIQSILFKRELYEIFGGFDESLILEDWDLWMRYSLKNDFLFIPEITSKYRVPAGKKESKRRSDAYNNSIATIRSKQKDMNYSANVFQSSEDIQGCIEFYKKEVTANLGETMALFLKMIRRVIR